MHVYDGFHGLYVYFVIHFLDRFMMHACMCVMVIEDCLCGHLKAGWSVLGCCEVNRSNQ